MAKADINSEANQWQIAPLDGGLTQTRGEAENASAIAAPSPVQAAAHNLALALWSQEERPQREEATGLVEQLLHLNPNDNQGMRHLVLAWYPVLSNWKRVEEILAAYSEDEGLECSYARCLNAFRHKRELLIHLEQAIAANPYVPGLLLGKMRASGSHLEGPFRQGAQGVRKARSLTRMRLSLY
jgi:hypothetical protein